MNNRLTRQRMKHFDDCLARLHNDTGTDMDDASIILDWYSWKMKSGEALRSQIRQAIAEGVAAGRERAVKEIQKMIAEKYKDAK